MSTHRVFETIGFGNPSIDQVLALVEGRLGVLLEEHDSSYRGGRYFRGCTVRGEGLILQRNYDEDEREWAEPAFQEFPCILYISDVAGGYQVVFGSDQAGTLIRRREIPRSRDPRDP